MLSLPIKFWRVSKNIILVLSSVFLVFGLVFLADRLIFSYPVWIFSVKKIPIIFPPYSEEEFISKDFRYKVKINSIGLRNGELSIPKPKNVFRIAVIGDSYTYGWGVEEEQTWVRLLESKIKIVGKYVEVVNMGKPGADLEDYLEIARVGIPVVEPDLVILALLQGDDLHSFSSEGLLSEDTVYRLMNFLFPNISRRVTQYLLFKKLSSEAKAMSPLKNSADKNRISAKNSAIEILKGFTEDEKKRFELLDEEIKDAFKEGLLNPFLVYVAVKYPDTLLSPFSEQRFSCQPNFETALKIVKKIKEISESAGAKLIVFSVPQSFYVNEHAFNTAKRLGFNVIEEMLSSDKVDEPAMEISNYAELPCIFITEEMRKYKNRPDLFYPLDMHPTPEGHKLIADNLAPKLQEVLERFYGN